MSLNSALSSLSSVAHEWLTSPDSLTKKLRLLTKNKAEHCLLFNDWDEARENWIRRMEWRHQNQVWMYCVVTIPRDSLVKELKTIGQRSIGDILFQDANLTRTPFAFTTEKEGGYTRTSAFCFKQRPIYITETFMPAFFQWLEIA